MLKLTYIAVLCLGAMLVGVHSRLQSAEPDRWEPAIREFERTDRVSPPKPGGVLFVGSSSIRKWNLDEYFPGEQYLNRGFGGSQIADSTRFADRIIVPHRPRLIVIYAGDNDIKAGRTAEQVADDFRAFVNVVHAQLPATRIAFIAIKPSLARWHLYPRMKDANQRIAEFIARDRRLSYVDIATPMLGKAGKPAEELFVNDQLHLSAEGYKLWAAHLKPHLRGN